MSEQKRYNRASYSLYGIMLDFLFVIHLLIDWLNDWLIDWLTDWLAGSAHGAHATDGGEGAETKAKEVTARRNRKQSFKC